MPSPNQILQVANAMRDGFWTPEEIAGKTGIPVGEVHEVLSGLATGETIPGLSSGDLDRIRKELGLLKE